MIDNQGYWWEKNMRFGCFSCFILFVYNKFDGMLNFKVIISFALLFYSIKIICFSKKKLYIFKSQ